MGCVPLRGSISEAESKTAHEKTGFSRSVTIINASLRGYPSFAGATAELLSSRLDDNLTIPISSGLVAYAAIMLLQIGA